MHLVSVIQEFKELEAWHVRFRDKRRHAQVRAFKHDVQNIFQSLKTLRVCACTNSHSFQLWEEKFECRLKVDTIRASSGLQTRCPEYFSKLENTARLRMHKFTQISATRRKLEYKFYIINYIFLSTRRFFVNRHAQVRAFKHGVIISKYLTFT